MQCSTKSCAQQRCFENGNDDFGVEAFWIGDAARVGYFVPLDGPLNGHPPSSYYVYRFCVHIQWVQMIYTITHSVSTGGMHIQCVQLIEPYITVYKLCTNIQHDS